MEKINFKKLWMVSGLIITVVSLGYYLLDTYEGNTVPHAYTWLIWAITQGTATWAARKGDGGFETYSLGIGTLLVILVLIFSIVMVGTSVITQTDTIMLIMAFSAIVIWWRFDQEGFTSLLIMTGIDVWGYLPSYEKAWQHQPSESLLSWIGITASGILALAAAKKYNKMTVTYVGVLIIADIVMLFILLL